MTTFREQAAIAVAAALAKSVGVSGGRAVESQAERNAEVSLDIADALAKAACKRWGHEVSITVCARGGGPCDQPASGAASEDETEEAGERQWMDGHTAAWASMLRHVLGELRGSAGLTVEQTTAVRLLSERAATVVALRSACRFGDDDWTDNLWLGDVVEKHLERPLVERDRRLAALLERLEWWDERCPVCRCTPTQGHHGDCDLARELQAART